jgi:hypothetical protein
MPRRLLVLAAIAALVLLAVPVYNRLTASREFNQLEEFDPATFDNPTNIDNPWHPMAPGTRYVYEGTTTEKNQAIAHRLEFTVTDLTKEIQGVQTVVAWILDYSDGELVEKEIAFYAQDNDGNVWYFGEHPEEYNDGKFVEAPTWIAGIQNARAGIKMQADPRVGTPSYSQGWGPEVLWTDRARVSSLGQETCTPLGCYEDVQVVEEYNREEPDAIQLKYYAPGVGNVRVGWEGADAQQEVLELVEYVQLSPEALAQVRTEALALEQHAYEISEDVYALTKPAEFTTSASE